MRRSPFVIFFITITVLVASALFFIQSQAFAKVFKRVVYRYLPKDLGVIADFSEFAIKIYPPGFSLKNPKISLLDGNILKMPVGSSVEAQRIDFDFRPFQMLSGSVRVNELVIVGGKLKLFYKGKPAGSPKAKSNFPNFMDKALGSNIHWDELLQFHAEAIVIQNSHATVEWIDTGKSVELGLNSLRFGQWTGPSGLGYEFSADLSDLGGSVLEDWPFLKSVQGLQTSTHISASGIQIDDIHFKGEGLEVKGNGLVSGDFQNLKEGLNLDAEITSEADVGLVASTLRDAYSSSPKASANLKDLSTFSGRASFLGHVKGNLLKALETLKLKGEFAAKDLQIRKFHADEAHASGVWTSSLQGGEIELNKATIVCREQVRRNGAGAQGGKIQIDSTKFKIGSEDPISLKLKLEKTQFQWLASIGMGSLKSIYPLLFKADGDIDAVITPPSDNQYFDLQAKVKLLVEDFTLDNQKIGVVRPLKRTFKFSGATIEGPVSLDEDGIETDGLRVGLGRTHLIAEGGVYFKKGGRGFDIHGYGPAHLADIGEIAENEIRGDGDLDVYVHGPLDKVVVDVDVDVKDAYYIHLAMGDLKGRITWDDDPDHLFIRKVQALKGSTQYSVDGMLDLHTDNSISLNAVISKGNISEFMQVFYDLTKELWWFPQSITGPFTGSLNVSGGLDLKELKVSGKLNGDSWDYLGERFDKSTLAGGYDRGKYYISNFNATKRIGHMNGRISFDDTGLFDWDFHTQQMTVSDLDHVAQLDVPIRGRISVDSTGKGRLGALVSETQMSVTDLLVHGAAMPSSQFFLSGAAGVYRAHGTIFGNQATLDSSYDFNPTKLSHLRAELKHLDFSPALLLLNPKEITDPQLSGFAAGSMDLEFHSGQIERADGSIAIDEYLLTKSGAQFQLKEPVAFTIKDGSFNLDKVSIQGVGPNQSIRSEASLSLKAKEAALDGHVTGDLDTSIAEFATSVVQKSSGLAHLNFVIGGMVKAPTLGGKAVLDGVGLSVVGLESPFEGITGTLEIKQNEIFVQDLESDLAGGKSTANGTILLFADRYPLISLRSEIAGSKLRFFPFQYAKLDGSLSVTGDHLPYLVEGSFKIDSALSKEKVMQQKQGQGLKALQYSPPPSKERLSDYPKFKLKIDAEADKGIFIKNDLFDAELKGKVTIINTIEAPRVLGTADLIQGKMTFKDHEFVIQSANGVFDNPTVINPKFNLTAKADVNGTKVQLYASGAMDNYKIEFSSTPVMAETDILQLLAIGVTPSEALHMNPADRSAVEQGEAASLLLHSLDFNREVQNKTGIQIQLDESLNSRIGTSAFAQAPAENSASPRIIIKKQLTKNLDISYGNTVGVGTASDRQVNTEYKVTPGFSLIGVWDNYQSTDSAQEKTNNYSYGLDLKLQKRFK